MNITFLIILIVWIFGLLFLKNTFKVDLRGSRKYLWLIVVSSLFVAIEMAVSNSKVVSSLPHFLYLSLPIQFLIVPTLYFLLRDKAKKRRKIKLVDYMHFIPSLVCLMMLWPFYAQDGTIKLNLIGDPSLLVRIIPWLLLVQTMSYLVIGLSKLNFFDAGKRDLSDNRWLLIIALTSYGIIYLLHVAGIQHYSLGLSVHLLLIMIAWRYHWLSHSKPKRQQANPDIAVIGLVEKAMREEKLYLQPDLTLSVLATRLELNTNKISAALNRALSMNYNDYLNQYRVKEVIRHLENKQDTIFTLEAISRMSGFRSLTTFNTAFKKQTGKTPRQYKV